MTGYAGYARYRALLWPAAAWAKYLVWYPEVLGILFYTGGGGALVRSIIFFPIILRLRTNLSSDLDSLFYADTAGSCRQCWRAFLRRSGIHGYGHYHISVTASSGPSTRSAVPVQASSLLTSCVLAPYIRAPACIRCIL